MLAVTPTEFTEMVLGAEVPDFRITTFYGDTNSELIKEAGGILKLAVVNSFWGGGSEWGYNPQSVRLGQEQFPIQLGFSTEGGSGAATHGVKVHVGGSNHRRVLLKIDTCNGLSVK